MNGQIVRGRYAPSPTGTLHLGNLRTALLAWLFARSAGGAFILRVEDLDLPRVRPGATARMLADLRWLGLDWDEGPDVGGLRGPYLQSMRQAFYEQAIARLRDAGVIYPCYCSRAELARIASAPQGNDSQDGVRYPGTCRNLTARERAAREAAGRRPALRFRAPEAPVTFDDLLAGTITESVAATTGDFIVCRSDGIVSYQLAVVVDDALMNITQIVRGRDLLSSTARQLALYDALGYQRPAAYEHVPLVMDAMNVRMAKRDAAQGLDSLRAAGFSQEQVLGALAASGGFWPADTPASCGELVAAFSPERLLRNDSVVII